MRRLLVIVLALAGCNANDSPTLVIGVGDASMLSVTLERGPDHVFGGVHASVNGIDCGAAVITKGSDGITWSQAPSPATATWQIDVAQVGASAHVVVTEDGDTFKVDAPTVGATRTPHVDTSLATPVVPGAMIAADDGVPSDVVSGGFEIDAADGSPCTVQWGTTLLPGAVELGLAAPADLVTDWWCGDYPATGTLVTATLSLDLWVAAPVTGCTGDDLTCDSVAIPDLHITTPISIQF